MKSVLKTLRDVALREGCTTEDAPVYSNCALEDTSVEQIYRGNLKKLIKVRQKYDPEDIMGQAGGFKIPLPEDDGELALGPWATTSAKSTRRFRRFR